MHADGPQAAVDRAVSPCVHLVARLAVDFEVAGPDKSEEQPAHMPVELFFDSRRCTNAALRVATTCSRSACDVRSCPRSGAPDAIPSPRASIPTASPKCGT